MLPDGQSAHIGEIERQLLGACLWSDEHGTDGLDEVAEILNVDDFGSFAHQLVFRVMLDLRSESSPVNAATIFQCLAKRRELAELGP